MTIKEIIAERNKNFNETQSSIKEAIKKWTARETQNLYARTYIIEQLKAEIDSLRLSLMDADKGFNVALKREISNIEAGLRESFLAGFEKPADYSTQITNALQALSMLGDTVDDKTASAILAPFKNDYDQLSIFRSILLKTVQDSNELDTRFEETFRDFNACQYALYICSKMSELAKSLFLHRKYDDFNEEVMFYGERFCAQYEGYDELADQEKITELASELERGDM